MKEKNKKTIMLAIPFACIIVSSILLFQNINQSGYISNFERSYLSIPVNDRWIDKGLDYYLDFFRNRVTMDEEDDGVLSLGIYLGEGGEPHLQLNNYESPLYFEITNRTKTEQYMMIKFFYNHEEINFKIPGTTNFQSEMLFTARVNEKIRVPLEFYGELNEKDSISRLTMFAISDPEDFAENNREIGKAQFLHMALDYEVSHGLNEKLSLQADPFVNIGESEFHGFSIYSYPSPIWDGALMMFQEPFVVERGQDAELTFFVNNHMITYNLGYDGELYPVEQLFDNFILISMIDWQQIDMSGHSYIYVEINDPSLNIGQYGTFTINVDKEPGFYEFTSILIMGPRDRMSLENFFPHEVFRFTIEVVE